MSLIKQSFRVMILFKSIRKCNTYIRDDTEIYFVISVLYISISFFYPFIFISERNERQTVRNVQRLAVVRRYESINIFHDSIEHLEYAV